MGTFLLLGSFTPMDLNIYFRDPEPQELDKMYVGRYVDSELIK